MTYSRKRTLVDSPRNEGDAAKTAGAAKAKRAQNLGILLLVLLVLLRLSVPAEAIDTGR